MLWGSQRESTDWSTWCRITDQDSWVCLLQRREDKGRFNYHPLLPKGENIKIQTLPRRAQWREEVTVTSCKEISTGYEEKIHHEGGSVQEQIAQRIWVSLLEIFKFQLGIRPCNPLWHLSWLYFEQGLEKKNLQRIPLMYILIIFWEHTWASFWSWK